MPQSVELYRALKQLGREVEYVRYPGAGHDLSRTGDPRQRMDRLNRIVEFFERFSLTADDVSSFAHEISGKGRDASEVASEWIANNSDRVDAWLGL